MGISDFYEVIKEMCPWVLVEISLSEMSGLRFAIDVSIFLNKFIKTVGPQRWLANFIVFLCCLKRNGIKPVCIFDGPNPPIEKKREQMRRRAEGAKTKEKIEYGKKLIKKLREEYMPDDVPLGEEILNDIKTVMGKRRGKNVDSVNYDDIYDVVAGLEDVIARKEKQNLPILPEYGMKARELVECMGFAHFTAPGEAETLCASMCILGLVDGVLSEDTDVMAYGTPYLIAKLDITSEKVTVVSHEAILEAAGLIHEEFLDLCILLSCDYNERVKGYPPDGRKYKKPVPIGAKKAICMIQEYRRLEEVEKHLENPDPLNYRRCRELFTAPTELPEIATLPCNGPILEDRLVKFLMENKVRITMDYIRAAWKPVDLHFQGENGSDEEILTDEE
jgi:5'-3' exonuclease